MLMIIFVLFVMVVLLILPENKSAEQEYCKVECIGYQARSHELS